MPKAVKNLVEKASLEPIFQLWGWILLIWSLYRYFLVLPEWFDELVAKPIVFAAPVLYFIYNKEKRKAESIGLTKKNFFPSLYVGLGFGMLFALEGMIANSLKFGKLTITPIASLQQYGLFSLLILSFATAFSEELLNRGFLFNRIMEKTQRLTYSALVSTVLFVLLHVPILVTSLKLHGPVLVLYFCATFLLGLINCFLYHRTKSLVAPILVHVFWNMTVALYL
jgi:membrane protease YdiL (CAAX protease family)